MANRRMVSKVIIDSDLFLDMPATAQNLYFHLLMRADDDGFVDSPKKIARMIGASEDDLRILKAKNFILAFESGVIVITHWRIHNYIQGDRYKPTFYRRERAQLVLKNNVYELKPEGTEVEVIPPSSPPGGVETKRIQSGYRADTDCKRNGYRTDAKCIRDGYMVDTKWIQPVSMVDTEWIQNVNRVDTGCIRDGYKTDTQVRLGYSYVRLGYVRLGYDICSNNIFCRDNNINNNINSSSLSNTRAIKDSSSSEDSRIITRTNEKSAASQRVVSRNRIKEYRPEWMPEEDWNDLIEHRRKVRAVNSERALKILRKELDKAHENGWASEEIVDEIVNRGWKGFKAEWLGRKKKIGFLSDYHDEAISKALQSIESRENTESKEGKSEHGPREED